MKTIKPRNFLVPVARFKKAGAMLDRKKAADRSRCRGAVNIEANLSK